MKDDHSWRTPGAAFRDPGISQSGEPVTAAIATPRHQRKSLDWTWTR